MLSANVEASCSFSVLSPPSAGVKWAMSSSSQMRNKQANQLAESWSCVSCHTHGCLYYHDAEHIGLSKSQHQAIDNLKTPDHRRCGFPLVRILNFGCLLLPFFEPADGFEAEDVKPGRESFFAGGNCS